MYTLYVVRCNDGSLYTGITVDIKRRIAEHNASKLGARYTRSRRPVKLVFSKKFRTRSTASRAEALLKQLTRREKLTIVRKAKKKK